jgi:copper(I)-binding protein
MKTLLRTALPAALLVSSVCAQAQVKVTDPWVRGTVAQQKASGMFVQLTSAQPARLVSASSPLAGVVEIHEMSMQGDVMRMRAIPSLELPAGKTVELKPGGLHLMLLDLKQPLEMGKTVPVTLVVETGGKRENVELQVPVRNLAGRAAPKGHHH